MAEEQRPREFWIEELQKNKWYVPHLTPSICDGMTNNPIIHVIEYSAYKELINIWQRDLLAERARNQKLREALIDISKSGTINGVKAKKALAEDKE